MPLGPDEISLAAQLGFETEVAELFGAATKSQLSPFREASGELAGVAARVIDGEAAETILKTIQPDLIQRGYRAFWTHLHEPDGLKTGDALALLRSTDHFAILDATTPCAEHHSGPEVIREKLKYYERLCDLEIVGASTDWVAVTFRSLPGDLCGFAEDVYLFRPDSCDLHSGIGSKRRYTKEVRAAAKALCPAVSESCLQQITARYCNGPAAAHLPAEFLDMLLKDVQWNVRLVAWELKQKMYFFFWWD